MRDGISPITHGSALYTDVMKTQGAEAGARASTASTRRSAARGATRRSRAPRSAFSRSATPPIVGTRRASGRSCGISYNAQLKPGESIRVFPLSNWTELDVWHYIHLENIPVVPLYFAAERPVVERDGMLIMVDDDRLPLDAGEKPQMRQRALSHAGLLSADRRDRVEAATAAGDHRGDCWRRASSERQGRVIDHDQRRLDGEEEAGRLFLMHALDSSTSRLKRRAAAQGSPRRRGARGLLRFLTCGCVDDGKSTLIGRLLFDSGWSTTISSSARARLRKRRARARRARSRAAGRRAGRRSASRRSPSMSPIAIFSTAAAQVHRRRHARATSSTPATWRPAPRTADLAVMLVDARNGRAARRRGGTPASSRCSASATSCSRSTRWTSSISIRRASTRSPSEFARFAAPLGFEHDRPAFRFRRSRATMWCSRARACPGITARRCSGISRPWMSRREKQGEPFRMPVQWVNRPHLDFRGYAGTVASGTVRPGDEVVDPALGQARAYRTHRHRRR